MSNTRYPHVPSFNRRNEEDVHQLLVNEMNSQNGITDPIYQRAQVNSIGGASAGGGAATATSTQTSTTTTGTGGTQISTTKRGIVDKYFYLDTDFREEASSLSDGRLVFDLSKLNNGQPIENIIEIELNDFYFPEIAASIQFPSYFFFRRMYLFIEELSTQSVLANASKKFHFEVGVQPAGITNQTTNVGGQKFIFNKPIQSLSISSINFLKPPGFVPVQFQEDSFTFAAVPGSSPAQITTTVPHGLTVTDDVSVFISGFGSNIGNVDNVINGQEGFLVNVDSTTTLLFDAVGVVGFDFTDVATAVTGTILIGFRRFAFTIRMRTLAEEETNTIQPV